MRLTDLEVRHFRNIRHARIEPAEGVNVFWGANAQGKTNMLEAAYYLVTGRSFRTRFDKECICWREALDRWAHDEAARDDALPPPPEDEEAGPAAVIRGRLRRESGAHELLVTINAQFKRISGDGKPIERLGLLWGRLNAVLFTPADLGIVQGGPGQRRQFLDTTLSQLSGAYLRHLQRYSYALKQRNALLRSHRSLEQMAEHFDVWEEQMAESGMELFRERLSYVERLSQAVEKNYDAIARKADGENQGSGVGDQKSGSKGQAVEIMRQGSGVNGQAPRIEEEQACGEEQEIAESQEAASDEETASDGEEARGDGGRESKGPPPERLSIQYHFLFKTREALESSDARRQYSERLRAAREDDKARGVTSSGPHRDDFVFRIQGRELRDYGSQGQQRSAVLALRLAEVEIMTERAGEPPVLLLDDIIGELDPARTRAFLDGLSAMPVQTFITATQLDDIARRVAIARAWKVRDGQFELAAGG